MSRSLSIDPSLQNLDAARSRRLPIALIAPNEGRRRLIAKAIETSPQVEIFEFSSYPPKRGYLRAVLESQFSVAVLELDSDPEHALDLIEEARECRGAAILAYSENADSKLALQRMKVDSLAYCQLLFDTDALSEEIGRIVNALCATPHRTGLDLASPPAISCTATADDQCIAAKAPEALSECAPSTLNTDLPNERQSLSSQGVSPDDDHAHSQEQILASSSIDSSSNSDWLRPESITADCEITPSTLQENDTKKRRIRELDPAEIREADAVLLQMFQRKTENVQKLTKPKQKGRLFLPLSIAAEVVLLIIFLLAGSHREQLSSKAHALLNSEIKYAQQTSHANKPLN